MRDTIADVEPLDNPVWHALTGPHARFADGDGRARRYQRDVAPFAALPDDPDAEAWGALANLAGTAGTAGFSGRPRYRLRTVGRSWSVCPRSKWS